MTPHSDLTTTINSRTAQYNHYRQMHDDFIASYAMLHAEVAAFVELPQAFINEAEPLIERYLKTINDKTIEVRELWREVMNDFIRHFYEFMDEATEMFVEHETLHEKTEAYIIKVHELNTIYGADVTMEGEPPYVTLIPDLIVLAKGLKRVKDQTNETAARLNHLQPVWDKIKEKIN